MSEESVRAEAVRFWWNKAIEGVAAARRELEPGHIPSPSIVLIMRYSMQSVLFYSKSGVNSANTVGSGPRLTETLLRPDA